MLLNALKGQFHRNAQILHFLFKATGLLLLMVKMKEEKDNVEYFWQSPPKMHENDVVFHFRKNRPVFFIVVLK